METERIDQGNGEIPMGNVLIIDDDELFCEMLSEMVTDMGHGVKFTHSLNEGVVEAINGTYDVVFLDVYLPVVNGLDLIPKITTRCPRSKIIIMTGYADKEIAIKALRLGAFDFMEKPFEVQILHHVLQRALDARNSEQQQMNLLEELKKSQQELTEHKQRLENLNSQVAQ